MNDENGNSLDRFLPEYRHNEVHEIVIAADPETVMSAVCAVTAGEIALARLMFGIRSLPSRLLGRPGLGGDADRPILEVSLEGGFLFLERSSREAVLGVVGRFWRLATRDVVRFTRPEEFAAFSGEGYAKAVVNFAAAPEGPGRTRLRTETRILPLGEKAVRQFGFYWLFVHPGSALLRRMWLRAVRRRAEGDSARPAG